LALTRVLTGSENGAEVRTDMGIVQERRATIVEEEPSQFVVSV